MGVTAVCPRTPDYILRGDVNKTGGAAGAVGGVVAAVAAAGEEEDHYGFEREQAVQLSGRDDDDDSSDWGYGLTSMTGPSILVGVDVSGRRQRCRAALYAVHRVAASVPGTVAAAVASLLL